MTDCPVLIPTSEGPVGGTVSEPPEEARAALLLMPGYGRPARSGVNSFWTRMARSLAEAGIVTLRVDYSREGETLPIGVGGSGQAWKRDLDLRLLSQALSWFRDGVGDVPMLLAGSCSGARLAIDLAGPKPDAIAETFLIVPYLRAVALPGAESRPEPGDLDTVDPILVDHMRAVLTHAPSWILVGEHDDADVGLLQRRLGATPHDLEVDVVPNVALHLMDQPHLQAEVSRRLIARVSGTVAATPQ